MQNYNIQNYLLLYGVSVTGFHGQSAPNFRANLIKHASK